MADKEDTEILFDLWKSRDDKEYSWVKQVISVIGIILGLIISLKGDSPTSITEQILFTITLLLNGLCVLVGLIFLHSEQDTAHTFALKYEEYIQSSLKNASQVPIVVDRKPIYEKLRVFFFYLLILSVVSLVTYGSYYDYCP